MALLNTYNQAVERYNILSQNPYPETDSPIKMLGRIPFAIMARKQKQKVDALQKQVTDARNERIESFKQMAPGSPEQLQFMQTMSLDPNVSPEERAFYNQERGFQHQVSMQQARLDADANKKARASVRGGFDAMAEWKNRSPEGVALPPVEEFFELNEDGTIDTTKPKFYEFSVGAPKPYDFGNKDSSGKTPSVEAQKYAKSQSLEGRIGNKTLGIQAGSRILFDVDNLDTLIDQVDKNTNLFTDPTGWPAHILDTWKLSDDATDFYAAADQIGAKITEDIRAFQESIGTQQKGPFTDADARRLEGIIAQLSPVDKDGEDRIPISIPQFKQKLGALRDEWDGKLRDYMFKWKDVKGETEGGKTTTSRRLFLFGEERPEFDITDKTDAEIFKDLTDTAREGTAGRSFTPQQARAVIRLIREGRQDRYRDPQVIYDEIAKEIFDEKTTTDPASQLTTPSGFSIRIE